MNSATWLNSVLRILMKIITVWPLKCYRASNSQCLSNIAYLALQWPLKGWASLLNQLTLKQTGLLLSPQTKALPASHPQLQTDLAHCVHLRVSRGNLTTTQSSESEAADGEIISSPRCFHERGGPGPLEQESALTSHILTSFKTHSHPCSRDVLLHPARSSLKVHSTWGGWTDGWWMDKQWTKLSIR